MWLIHTHIHSSAITLTPPSSCLYTLSHFVLLHWHAKSHMMGISVSHDFYHKCQNPQAVVWGKTLINLVLCCAMTFDISEYKYYNSSSSVYFIIHSPCSSYHHCPIKKKKRISILVYFIIRTYKLSLTLSLFFMNGPIEKKLLNLNWLPLKVKKVSFLSYKVAVFHWTLTIWSRSHRTTTEHALFKMEFECWNKV